jgi:hypothetical protein
MLPSSTENSEVTKKNEETCSWRDQSYFPYFEIVVVQVIPKLYVTIAAAVLWEKIQNRKFINLFRSQKSKEWKLQWTQWNNRTVHIPLKFEENLWHKIIPSLCYYRIEVSAFPDLVIYIHSCSLHCLPLFVAVIQNPWPKMTWRLVNTFNSAFQSYTERRMVSSGMLRRVALVRTDVSEELSSSFIRVTRIGELGTLEILGISSQRASVASCS